MIGDFIEGGSSTRMDSERCVRRLVGKFDGKSPLDKPERRCEYDIKDHFKEILYEDEGWIRVAPYRLQL
jgi:hypothetical protein